ncbi:MAB_1171c family putative transporter [Streptomyces sp. NPDC097619]|uniref:MAB_1171c family putative transporter n=1 Tax=Streptomyces sp. NPDC097619 TaxID=3157228 RepID=UPI0033292CEC
MNSSTGHWILTCTMWLACLVKVPTLRHHREPLHVTVCLVPFFGGVAYFTSNPQVIGVVNAWTGVDNFSAPLVYSLLTVVSALIVTLLVHWREGTEERARRTSRRVLTAYGATVVGIVLLFAAGEAPVERRVDFDTYYATTPFIREMILLYLTAHAVSVTLATTLCIRWFALVRGQWLRRGLRLLIVGFALGLGMDACKFLAVGARWAGADWDLLNTGAAPLFAFGYTLLTGLGFILPVVGSTLVHTWGALRSLVQLRPLWCALQPAAPAAPPGPPVPWWEIDLRVTRRVAEIHDGRLALRPYRDRSAAAAAADRARATGLSGAEAAAAVEAEVLATALARLAASNTDRLPEAPAEETCPVPDPSPALDREALVRVARRFRRPEGPVRTA